MQTTDPNNDYYSKRVLKRLETVPARHHLNQRIYREASQALEQATQGRGEPGMEVLLEQLYRGSKALQGLATYQKTQETHDQDGRPKAYIDLGEAGQVALQQDLFAGHDLLDALRDQAIMDGERPEPAYWDGFPETIALKKHIQGQVDAQLSSELQKQEISAGNTSLSDKEWRRKK